MTLFWLWVWAQKWCQRYFLEFFLNNKTPLCKFLNFLINEHKWNNITLWFKICHKTSVLEQTKLHQSLPLPFFFLAMATCYSLPDETVRLTDYPHIVSYCVALHSRGWQQSTPHYTFLYSTMIQTVHPFMSLQVLHQLGSSCCPRTSSAPQMDRSQCVGFEPFPLLRGPTVLCFSVHFGREEEWGGRWRAAFCVVNSVVKWCVSACRDDFEEDTPAGCYPRDHLMHYKYTGTQGKQFTSLHESHKKETSRK